MGNVTRETHAVTGAFGYSGGYIAAALLERGICVRTLTNSPKRHSPLTGKIGVFPLLFRDTAQLTETLRGVRVLYNTYWVRFNHRSFTFAQAVENTLKLFEAAQKAGVERIVHTSITRPTLGSPYEYFRGKARLEQALGESGISHAILRPAVLFGGADILVNNIAWVLRRFPVVGVFGDGRYRVQPIHVRDFAALALDAGESRTDTTVDAVGPECFAYEDLVREVGRAIGAPRPLLHVPAWTGHAAAWALGWLVRDVVLTRGEIGALMDNLLWSGGPPTGQTRLTEWMRAHSGELGRRYHSELARRTDRLRPYDAL